MIKDLTGLLMHLIQSLNAAEEQMMRAMPAIIEKVNHSSLKNALTHHLNLTTEQKKRLEQVAQLLNQKNIEQQPAELKPEHICKGMMGLIEETNEILQTGLEKDVTDAAIIACIQKMEHYEISTYGTALAYAHQLHLVKAEELLNETLNEEYEADDLLTALATASLNKEAVPQDKDFNQANSSTGSEENESSEGTSKIHITERTINSPGGRAGTSHRRYGSGESRGH